MTASSKVQYLHPRTLLLMFGLAAVYLGAAKLGLSLAVMAEQVSAVWPPTGVALAAVVVYGYRIWPGILLGAFLANATANEPITTACGVAVGNTLEAIVGSWLLGRCVGFDRSLERLKDVLGLIVLAAGVSTAVSATIGVLSLCLGGVQPWSNFASLWSVWWLGDALGGLVVAPFLLTTAICRRPPLRRTAEAALLAISVGVIAQVIFNGWTTSDPAYSSLAYTVFPLVVWAALRFGQPGATSVTFVVSVFAVWGVLRGVGPFGWGTVHDRLVSLQAFMAVVAATGLILAAALAERRRDEQRTSVLHAVAEILAESKTLDQATPQIIQRICDSFTWQVGAIWEVDRASAMLKCAGFWHTGSTKFPVFETTTRGRTFASGVGLPGRVWATGVPVWIPDVVHDANFPRAPIAEREGLHAAFGFPIRLGAEIHGVIEFFSPQIRRPDEDLLQTMGTLGIQIGQFIERRHGEEEVRRSEALKTAVLESALDAIITIDHQGGIVEFNPGAEKMFGWPRVEAIGKPLVDLVIPKTLKEKFQQGMLQYLATGHGPILDKRLELPAVRSDGTEFPVELAVTRIFLPGPPMFTGYIRDVTERKKLEDALRERAVQLSEADRRKNEFLATLAHELRNPLAPIRNGLQILRLCDGDRQATGQALDMMDRQLSQMVHLIDDLLDLSRVSRGTIELRKQRIELAKVVEHAVEMSRPVVELAGHRLTLAVPPNPIFVDADLTRLAQVFSNLLNNAAKYTEPGGDIRLLVEQLNGEVVVSVRDNGIGIPRDMLPHVFDMFTAVNRNLQRSQGGLGIGLSIVKKLVEMHGGLVEATSDGDGMGSQFVVRLPVVLSVVQPQADDDEPIRPTSRCRILVVDDNHDAANSLAKILGLKGNESLAAHDGHEAIQQAAIFRPDVILLDIGMPGLNGYETAKQIRAQPWGKNLLLVALTGWGQDEDRRRSQDAGFDAHIVKPINAATLEKLLASSKAAIG
jgi:PAS domain S-box-containing protein